MTISCPTACQIGNNCYMYRTKAISSPRVRHLGKSHRPCPPMRRGARENPGIPLSHRVQHSVTMAPAHPRPVSTAEVSVRPSAPPQARHRGLSVRLDLSVERRTGPLPLPTAQTEYTHGRSGGGAGWCGDFPARENSDKPILTTATDARAARHRLPLPPRAGRARRGRGGWRGRNGFAGAAPSPRARHIGRPCNRLR